MQAGARHVAGGQDAPVRRRRRPWLLIAWSLAAVVLLAGVGAIAVTGAAVWRLHSNIHAVDVSRRLGTDRPTAAPPDAQGDRPLNVSRA